MPVQLGHKLWANWPRALASSLLGGFRTCHVPTTDVPRAVYEHAVTCEYAHAHLRAIAKLPAPAHAVRRLTDSVPGSRLQAVCDQRVGTTIVRRQPS